MAGRVTSTRKRAAAAHSAVEASAVRLPQARRRSSRQRTAMDAAAEEEEAAHEVSSSSSHSSNSASSCGSLNDARLVLHSASASDSDSGSSFADPLELAMHMSRAPSDNTPAIDALEPVQGRGRARGSAQAALCARRSSRGGAHLLPAAALLTAADASVIDASDNPLDVAMELSRAPSELGDAAVPMANPSSRAKPRRSQRQRQPPARTSRAAARRSSFDPILDDVSSIKSVSVPFRPTPAPALAEEEEPAPPPADCNARLHTYMEGVLAQVRASGQQAGCAFTPEQERLLLGELQRQEEETADLPPPTATAKLSRVLRAIQSGPFRHAQMEFHSLPRRSIFPDPGESESGVLLSLHSLHGVRLRVDTSPTATGRGQLARTGLYLEDATDPQQRRLLPLYSESLGYGEDELTHKNLTALKRHLNQMDEIIGNRQWPQELDCELFDGQQAMSMPY